ncbi:hypothetical protein PI124_g23761, partial [Phytophthora idaei]
GTVGRDDCLWVGGPGPPHQETGSGETDIWIGFPENGNDYGVSETEDADCGSETGTESALGSESANGLALDVNHGNDVDHPEIANDSGNVDVPEASATANENAHDK